MTSASGAPAEARTGPPPSRRPRLSRTARLGIGLVLTFVGLLFLVLLFPTAPDALARELPIAAVGIIALWVGGILMGMGSRS